MVRFRTGTIVEVRLPFAVQLLGAYFLKDSQEIRKDTMGFYSVRISENVNHEKTQLFLYLLMLDFENCSSCPIQILLVFRTSSQL